MNNEEQDRKLPEGKICGTCKHIREPVPHIGRTPGEVKHCAKRIDVSADGCWEAKEETVLAHPECRCVDCECTEVDCRYYLMEARDE